VSGAPWHDKHPPDPPGAGRVAGEGTGMDAVSALLAFTLAATLLTLTPGLDTALVLRAAAVDGARAGRIAALGVVAGVMGWGLIAALGLGAVLAVSTTAYAALQIAGALYLLWLGGQMLARALRAPAAPLEDPVPVLRPTGDGTQFARGLMTNLLNPKVGLFYVSFLPQFIPPDQNVVAFSLLLAAIHAGLGVIWFGLLTGATARLAGLLARPAVKRALDGTTGALLIGCGLSLALERRA